MATSTLGGSVTSSEDIRSIFVTGVRNAHALEKEAIQILSRQLESHIAETEGQIARLDRILADHGTDASGIKDTVLSMVGGMAALGHTVAPDEILKNSFANFAFENFEIAAYKSLIVMAEAAGESRFVPLLRQNLTEDENAARLIYEQVEPITRKYLSRASSGQKADR